MAGFTTSRTTMAVDKEGETTISAVHSDVLLTHILTRLDGPTLASVSCASSEFQILSTQQDLWTDICHATWPSTRHPRVHYLISSFPKGPRSFFSDSFPLLVPRWDPAPSQNPKNLQSSPPPELISAVDIHYKNNLIFSKVQETETLTGWFRCSPFRIDILDPKDVIPTQIHSTEYTCQDLAAGLTLSWIIIDPIRRRPVNISSRRAVSVQQHWLSGEIHLNFATILAVDQKSTEFVQCGIVVACGRCEEGKIYVREVSLQVEDMDGMNLIGKDSLGILHRAIESGERKKERGEEGKEIFEEYLKKKEEKKQRKLRRERNLDTMCKAFGVCLLAAFSMFVLFS